MPEAIEGTTSALDASPSFIQLVWRQRRKNPLNAMTIPPN
jgi:surface antigen